MRKIGELKGKPISEGNPNEIKKNQIHYKESDGNITLSERKEDNTLSSVTSGSGSGGGNSKYRTEYYKIEDINSILMLVELNINVIYNTNVSLPNTVVSVILAAFANTPEYIKSNIISINFPQYFLGKECNNIEEIANTVSPENAELIKTLLNNPVSEEEFLYDFYNK